MGQGQTGCSAQAFRQCDLNCLEQGLSVGVGCCGARIQHVAVASGFLVCAESTAGIVGKWIEPQAGNNNFRHLKSPQIGAFDVGQLMRQSSALLGKAIVLLEPGG